MAYLYLRVAFIAHKLGLNRIKSQNKSDSRHLNSSITTYTEVAQLLELVKATETSTVKAFFPTVEMYRFFII